MRRALVFTGRREVSVKREPRVEPEPGEVSVSTTVSAISPGTELLVYRDEAPDDLPADSELEAIDGDLAYPLRYGYAAVGEVDAAGDAVADGWLGETVFAFAPHASQFTARPETLLRVPDGVSPEAAALFPTVETAVNLVLDGAPRIGERVVVFGQGVVGLTTAALLERFPLDQLVAVEPVDARRRLSRSLGVDYACAPGALEALGATDGDGAAATGGGPGDGSGAGGADLVYELSGNPEALDAAVDVADFDGRVIVGSWYGTKPVDLDLGGRFHRSRVSLESSQVSTVDPGLRGRWDRDRRHAVAWDRLVELPVERFPFERLPIDDAPIAYELLDDDPDADVGVLLTY